MSNNTYFQHYVMHYYIAKTLKVYHMQYRLQKRYFFMHKSLKRDDKKENDEIKKKMRNN